jgi:hypothetical protein
MDDKELTQALTLHLQTSAPFSLAFQLFQKYCATEARTTIEKLSEEEKSEMYQQFRELGLIESPIIQP